MTMLMTSLQPIASWEKVHRYRMMLPHLIQVTVNLMIIKKPSYSKLATIATKQQTALEKLQNLLDRSHDLLNDEMNLTQILTEDVKSLQSRFDNLQDRHDTPDGVIVLG